MFTPLMYMYNAFLLLRTIYFDYTCKFVLIVDHSALANIISNAILKFRETF